VEQPAMRAYGFYHEMVLTATSLNVNMRYPAFKFVLVLLGLLPSHLLMQFVVPIVTVRLAGAAEIDKPLRCMVITSTGKLQ
jgi:hypothetical protein